ncbi:MAG: glycine oxidase ThiO [Solirubrobacteraceae bacterium]
MSQGSATAADLVVVGAGAIGLAIAWRAVQRGLRVVVLERSRAGGATSHVAAGMLAPVAEVTPGEESLLELGLRSAGDYPRFLKELAESAGVSPGELGYTPCGTLLVARDSDEAEALERELGLRDRLGLTVERLLPSEARRREPGLAPALRLALDVPNDHAIDPRALTAALVGAVRRGGGELREGIAVEGLRISGDRVCGVALADGSVLGAGAVVVAAGVWSAQLSGLTPDAVVPVRPVKGQIIRCHDPAGAGLLTRVIRMGPSYVVPRGDGRYVIGATSEERGFDVSVTAGAAFALLRDASELVPGVSEWVLDEFSAGLRPGTPDNLPAIGPGAIDGLHWAVGHRRGGILLAPITAELVLAGLTGGPLPGWAQAFSAGRFAPAGVGSPA